MTRALLQLALLFGGMGVGALIGTPFLGAALMLGWAVADLTRPRSVPLSEVEKVRSMVRDAMGHER